MNWGNSIILTFFIFAAIIITMVTISMRQDVNLVEKNYYEEEIAYQDQIDRINNFNELKEKPSIRKKGKQLVVTFPEVLISSISKGQIQLYRPSTSKLDRRIKIALTDQGNQTISLQGMEKGLWKVKLRWNSTKKEYFNSQSIVL
ncbi:MAG: FixH family protein [Reichenbachiella sp.]